MPMDQKTKDALFLAGVYVAMAIGMAAKAFFDHLTEGVVLQAKMFLIPLLVSPMVYAVVYRIVQGSNEKLLMLIFSFQNGFFWQDIFGKIVKEVSNGTGPVP